jgi:hypothetical protein
MRDYGRVAPTFWTRGSGKKLRGKPIAQVVALYLFTCPASTMIGIYHLAIPTMAHETGLSIEDAERGLADVCALGIARHDPEEELVYLPEGARYQIGERLKGIEAALAQLGRHPFALDFARRYAAEFCLRTPAGAESVSPIEPPSDPAEQPPEGASNPLPATGASPFEARQGSGKDQAITGNTHIASAPAREGEAEDDDRLRPPSCSEADLADLLRAIPVLADLADDPATVTDLHSGFVMSAFDDATVDLARAALGALVGAENLRDMPAWKRRERAGRYLGNARKCNRPSDRGSDPARVTDDQRVVLAVFGETWAARKRRDFAQSAGDEKHAAAIVEAAWEHAARLKMRPRDIVRHWCTAYLADSDKFVADPEHPLRLLPSRLTTYGLPPPKREKPAQTAAVPFTPSPPPADLLASLPLPGSAPAPPLRRPGGPS